MTGRISVVVTIAVGLMLSIATMSLHANAGADGGQSSATFTLSGTVYGGGSPLPSTLVEALQNGTTTVVASSTANSSGHYSMTLADGTYDLRVTPPSGSGFGQETVQNITISGADRQYDVILLAASGGSISGTVRGLGGQGIANASVSVYSSQSGQYLASAQTDSNGHYSVAVGSGTVGLNFNYGYPQSPYAPQNWYASKGGLSVSGATTFDLNLPVVQVSGVVTGSDGATVGNASISANASSYDSANQISYSASAGTTSSASGAYSLMLVTGQARFSVYPPAASGYTPFSESNVSLTGDTTRNFILSAATQLSGTVRGLGGQPIANASVSAYSSQTGQYLASAQTDANGHYTLGVSPGTVGLNFNYGYPQSPYAPQNWYASKGGLSVSGATTFDLNLPVVQVNGVVTDSNGAGVPNVSISANDSSYDSANQISYSANAAATSGASGTYSLMLVTGQARFSVYPPSQSGFLPASLSNVSLSGNLTQRIILQHPDLSPPQIVAGPIVIHLSDTSVSISWTTNEAATSQVQYGLGSVSSTIGNAALTTNHTITLVNLAPLSTYSFRVGSVDASGNGPTYSPLGTFNTLASPGDITPPTITGGPTVVFVDQTSAIVQWTTDEPSTSLLGFGLTDALGGMISDPSGSFTQTHSLKLTGLSPETTYFAQVTSADPDDNLTSSSLFSFTTLAVPDTTPPIITAGPSVASKTDTKIVVAWTTNEPATSGVSYNDGTHFNVVSDTALTRDHQITLSGLTAQTAYSITVSTTDAVGNGPTLGGPIQATTNATPDTTPPVISNVAVSDIKQSSAVISWSTDERGTSAVSFGPMSGAPDNSQADVASVTAHSITMTGLHDGTRYYLTVSSTDASGNNATSSEISFVTESAFVDMPPTSPGPITAPGAPTRADSFSISWGPSTDDLAVVGYDVLRDSQVVTSVAAFTTSYLESGLPEGSYVYEIRATDSAGHTAVSAPVTVVVDRTAPQIQVPSDITADAVGVSAPIVYTASATDNLDAQVAVSCAPVPGNFPVGTTDVICTATDTAGNQGAASFSVTVRDVTPPFVTVPADQLLDATGPKGAVATFTASAVDEVSGTVAVTCSPESGSAFPVGSTTVTCIAVDGAGNSNSASFTVAVQDKVAPVVTVPANQTLEATGPSGAVATFAASAFDVVSGQLAAGCSPASGSIFGLGTTKVTCTTMDAAGNQGSASFTITVRDTTAPAIDSATPSQISLWPPNHLMVPLALNVVVSDAYDSAPACQIAGIASNEPINGTGDGDTAPDWSIDGGLTFSLRAERAGNGGGRLYTITVRCSDSNGNAATKTATVSVPKS